MWIRLPRHKLPKSWSSMEDPVVPLERNLYGHLLAGLLWERQFDKILVKYGWEKVSNWECSFVHREKGSFLSVYLDDIKVAGKKQNIDPMWKVLNKEVDLGEPTSFLDHVHLGCTQRQCEIRKDIVDKYRAMFESRILGVRQKNYHSLKIFVFLHGLMIWKVMPRNVWSDIVSWPTRRLNNATKYLIHASMTTTSEKKKWNLLENCHKYAPKWFWNAYTWHELEDLIFYGQWTNLHDQSQNGPKRVLNNADWDCFKTPILREILRVSKSTSGETLCVFGSHTFVPISWMCKKQLLFRTVQQNLRSSLWILDWD